jgi:hypothetical protein
MRRTEGGQGAAAEQQGCPAVEQLHHGKWWWACGDSPGGKQSKGGKMAKSVTDMLRYNNYYTYRYRNVDAHGISLNAKPAMLLSHSSTS